MRCSERAWKMKKALGHVIREVEKDKKEGKNGSKVEVTEFKLSQEEFDRTFYNVVTKRFKDEFLTCLRSTGEKQYVIVIFHAEDKKN